MINYKQEREAQELILAKVADNNEWHTLSDLQDYLGHWQMSELIESYVGASGKIELPVGKGSWFYTRELHQEELHDDLVAKVRSYINGLRRLITRLEREPQLAARAERDRNPWGSGIPTENPKRVNDILRIWQSMDYYPEITTTNKVKMMFDGFKNAGTPTKTIKSIHKLYKNHFKELLDLYGMKINEELESKVVDAEDSFEKVLNAITALEQSVSTNIETKGRLVISGLSSDVLTASDTPAFRSCFAPDGEYNLSPLGYLKNENVLVAYFVKDGETLDDGLEMVDMKRWRTFIFIDEDGYAVGSQYPNKNDTLMDLLFAQLEKIKPDITERGSFSYHTVFYTDGIWQQNVRVRENDLRIVVDNSNFEISPVTGQELTGDENFLYSSIEDDNEYCEWCEDRHHLDSLHRVDDFRHDMQNELLMCENCIDNSQSVYVDSDGVTFICHRPDQIATILNNGAKKWSDSHHLLESFDANYVAIASDDTLLYFHDLSQLSKVEDAMMLLAGADAQFVVCKYGDLDRPYYIGLPIDWE